MDAIDERPPLVLITDGSFEPEDVEPAPVDGLLIDPVDGSRWVLGGPVLEPIVQHWMKDGRVQVIAQCELLPALVAFRMFPGKLRGRPLLYFQTMREHDAAL